MSDKIIVPKIREISSPEHVNADETWVKIERKFFAISVDLVQPPKQDRKDTDSGKA